MAKFIERAKEPSTYAGLAAIIYGVGEVFKVNEAPALAETVSQAGLVVGQTGNITIGVAGILAGILSIFLSEKKEAR